MPAVGLLVAGAALLFGAWVRRGRGLHVPLADDRVEQARRRSARTFTRLFVVVGALFVDLGFVAGVFARDGSWGVLLAGLALALVGVTAISNGARRVVGDDPLARGFHLRTVIGSWGLLVVGVALVVRSAFV